MDAGMAELQLLQAGGLHVDEPVQIGHECLGALRWTQAAAARIGLSARTGIAALQAELTEIDLEIEASDLATTLLSRLGGTGNRAG